MLRPYSCQLSWGSIWKINYRSLPKNSSPNASPVQLSVVMGKHLEDKLSVIAKNSSPNASPVELSWGRKIFSVPSFKQFPKLLSQVLAI
jgi:hypothetical protein